MQANLFLVKDRKFLNHANPAINSNLNTLGFTRYDNLLSIGGA
jgi:hypothetical protein